MIVRIPAEFRQPYRWIGNLDAVSACCVFGSVAWGTSIFTGQGPWLVRLPETASVIALGCLLGLGKWPLEVTGDRALLWISRGWDYYWRSKVGSGLGK